MQENTNADLEQQLQDCRRQLAELALALQTERTARQEAEAAWRETEFKFRAVFEQTFQFTGLLTAEGILLEANQTALEFGGFEREDVVNRPFWEARWWTISPETEEQLRAAISQAAAGEFIRYEVDVLGKGDHVVTIDFSLKPMKDETGQVVLLIAEGRDITQLKQAAQQELYQEKATILESITDAFFAVDQDWRFTYVNCQAEQLLHTTRAELLGRDMWDIYSQAIGTTFYHEYHRAMAQKITIRLDEFCVPLNTWFEAHIYPNKNGLSVYFRDLTERKRTEQELYQREQEFRALAENSPDLITRIDRQLRHMYVNAAVATAAGLSAQAFIGKTHRELGIPEAQCDFWESHLLQVLTTKQEQIIEFDVVTPETTRHYQSRLVPEFAPDGTVESLLGIARDVTDIKQTEKALRENQQLLQAILDAAPVYIFAKDLQGRYLLSSRFCAEEALGLSPEQIIGKTDYNLFGSEIADLFRANDQAVLKAGKPLDSEESVPKPDGLHTVIATKFPLYDLFGVPYAICGISVDITERKRAEEALHQREQEFRALAENSPDLITRIDRQLRHMYVNAAIEKATGLSPQDFIGKTNRELGMPEALCIFWEENFQQVFTTEQEHSFEFDFLAPDGRKRYYQSRVAPEFAPDGSVETLLVVARDLTDFKQTEKALRESQQLLQAILDAAPICIYLKDLQGRFILVNCQCQIVLGLSQEQIIGKTDDDILPQHIAEVFQASDRAVLEAGTPLEWEQVFPEADRIHTSITTKFPLYDTAGTPYAICGMSTDITERKQIETALRESEERFRQFAENVDAVFWMRSLDQQQNKQGFLYISPAYEKIWGRTRENLYQQPSSWLDAIHPEDLPRLLTIIERQRQGEYPVRVYRIVLPDGSIRWIQDRTFPIHNAEGRVYRVAGIGEDITERKQAEEQLKASLQEKEALLKEVHHRVKNNLQVISSLLDLQSQQMQDSAALEAFRESQNRVRSIALIHEKLYQSENLARVNLADYINTLTTYLLQAYPINPNSITLQVKVNEIVLNLDKLIPCGLIINELVANALKHGFPENRKGRIWVEFNIDSLEQNEHQLILTVGNDGIKIQNLQDIYNAKTLGLQLVNILVSQLEGQMEVEQSRGTEFKIRFSNLDYSS